MKLYTSSLIVCAATLMCDGAQASTLPSPRHRRQMSGSMPYSLSGFDDPTIDIIDRAFDTAMANGYPGIYPASYQDHALTGPVHILQSSMGMNGVNPNVTIPLYSGMSSANKQYWWIVTDTSDQGNAEQLGLNYAPKLRFTAQSNTTGGLTGAEQLMIVNNTIAGRQGMVDFTPVRNIVPGDAAPFPPKSVQPGSVGDSNYTPMIQLMNAGGEIWNAPIVAGECSADYLNQFCNGVPANSSTDFYSKVHDQVVAICPMDNTVTLKGVRGFAAGRSNIYLVADGSDPLPATLDGATYASRLSYLQTSTDGLFIALEPILVASNGFTNADLPSGGPNGETHHPWRQGLDSAILGDGVPLNVLGAIPTNDFGYSPLWNFQVYTWTNFSISAGIRTRLTAETQVSGMAAAGYITNPDGTPLSNAGIVNNCPIVHRFI